MRSIKEWKTDDQNVVPPCNPGTLPLKYVSLLCFFFDFFVWLVGFLGVGLVLVFFEE